jgi:Na+/proline symporter
MVVLAVSKLEPADWAVLGGYLALLAVTGWWWARRASKSEQDYFFASRTMPGWVVAISLIATAQSAATFLGVPTAAFKGSYSYILGSCGYNLGGTIASLLFVQHYHRLGVRSPYEMIERAAGKQAKLACVGAFVVGKLLGAGARTYIGALLLSIALFGNMDLDSLVYSITGIMVVSVLFTLYGGVRSVIWTDVLQVGVYMGAAFVAIGVLLAKIGLPIGDVFHTLRDATTASGISKLTVFDFGVRNGGIDWPNQFTVLTALTGTMLLCIAVLVSDQDAVQRVLSVKSPREAVRTTILAQVLGVPVVLVFLTIGMLLFVFYSRASGVKMPEPGKEFQEFIFEVMSPGVRGLMIAGVLAIGPIGINATLNSMASVISNDLLPARAESDADPRRARLLVIYVGFVLLLVSIFAAWYQQHSKLPLIDFALNSLAFCFAPLLAIIMSLMLLRRGNALSVIAALVTGFTTCTLLQPPVVAWLTTQLAPADGSQVAALLAWAKTLAFPWHFVLAWVLSLCVCALGKASKQVHSAEMQHA